MANFSANSVNFAPFADAFTGGANAPTGNQRYYADGNLGDHPFETEPVYRDMDVEFVAIFSGVGEIRMLWLGRKINATLLFVGTEAQVRTLWTSTLASFRPHPPVRYTVALPNGASYPGCVLESFPDVPKFVSPFVGDIMVFSAPVIFRQKSTSN